MKYFRLTDKVGEVPDRWHLGDLLHMNSHEPVALEEGLIFNPAIELYLPLSETGRVLSYFETSFGVRVATRDLVAKMETLAHGAFQRLPVKIAGHAHYEIIHVINQIECVDESRTEVVKWQLGEGRDDLVGGYRVVRNLKIKDGSVPANTHFFGVKGWSVGLIVSDEMKTLMESAGCFGAQFSPVT